MNETPSTVAGPPHRHGRWWRFCALTVVGLMAAWSGGFAWFLAVTAAHPVDLPPVTDGIVALTGGPARVETALRLLADGRGARLLISGIGGGTDLAALAHRAGLEPAPFADRVTLGRSATTTRGNAAETRAWAQAQGVHSLTVVTAHYHMPRAMAELRRALPDVALHAYPVWPTGGTDRPRAASVRTLAEEYTKYLVAAVGLSAWLPNRDLPRAGQA